MNPAKVTRNRLNALTDLPNIGKAGEADLNVLGIYHPNELKGKCPYEMQQSLCEKTGVVHDVCVIDVFISITHFVNGGEAKPWWHYTQERKKHLARGKL